MYRAATGGETAPLTKQLHELLDRQARLPKDGAQRSAIEFGVIRNDKLGKWIVTPKHDMASVLTTFRESGAFQRIDALAAGDLR